MRKASFKQGFVAFGLLLLAISAGLSAQSKKTAADPVAPSVSNEKILSYVRQKFGVSDNVVLAVDPFKTAQEAGYLSSAIEVGTGKDKKTNPFMVSKDGRTIVFGNLVPLSGEPVQAIEQQIRQANKLPANVNLAVGPFHSSKFWGFEETTLTAIDGGKQQTLPFFVTRDHKYLLLGSIFSMDIPPNVQALRIISLTNQPTQGPANAPVTIVEYADLECPTCARLHQLFEEDLVPKYGNKIRIVFKEFPLYQIHDWAVNGAVASQCVYEINPAAFVNFRSLVFQHQASITGANFRDALLQYGSEAGVDSVKLAGCLDTRASLPRVEASINEAHALDVNQTPSCFINGRLVVAANPDDYYHAIDEALAARRVGASGAGQGSHTAKTRKKTE